MEYQVDTRNYRTQELRVGEDNLEKAVFRKAGFLISNLAANVGGASFQMKLPAPWNQFRYRLRQGDHELANAKKKSRMHAFEPDRPLIRHWMVEFELDIQGRILQLTPQDRSGLSFVLRDGDEVCGRLTSRTFEAQQEGSWEADLQAPAGWSVPLAAFTAWLAREGRGRMGI